MVGMFTILENNVHRFLMVASESYTKCTCLHVSVIECEFIISVPFSREKGHRVEPTSMTFIYHCWTIRLLFILLSTYNQSTAASHLRLNNQHTINGFNNFYRPKKTAAAHQRARFINVFSRRSVNINFMPS